MAKQVVGFLPAGYPDPRACLEAVTACEGRGVDVFEIGYPVADAYLDGAVIQAAHRAVARAGIPGMAFWRELRRTTQKPIWVMAYPEFADDPACLRMAEEGLVDAYVLPACTPAQRRELAGRLAPLGVEVLGIAGPGSSPAALAEELAHHPALYWQRYAGKTGKDHAAGSSGDHPPALAREYPGRRLYAGFGVSDAATAAALCRNGFDGVVVGTAFLRAMDRSLEELYRLVEEICTAVHKEG